MTTFTRTLLVLLTIRLMVPPGICICQASSPIFHALARVTGNPHPPAEDHHEDHHPGCTCSPLSAAMGLKPASPSVDVPALSLDPPHVERVDAPSGELPIARLAFSTTPPVWLSGCVLLI